LLRIAASQTKGENLFIFDSRSEDLDEYKSHIDTRYMSNEEETLVFLNTLIFTLEDRKRNYDSSDKSMKAKDFYKTLEPLSICIDDVSRFLSVFQANEKEMVDVLAMASDMNATIFASTVPNQISGLGQLAKYFKDTKNGIVLGNPADQSYLTPGLRQEAAVDIGYLYNNGSICKVKLPLV
jgi:hypothetical protein